MTREHKLLLLQEPSHPCLPCGLHVVQGGMRRKLVGEPGSAKHGAAWEKRGPQAAQCKDQNRASFLVHKWASGQNEGTGGVRDDEKVVGSGEGMHYTACV